MSTNPYTTLASMFGNHTKAAEALGITPGHYRHIRRTGKMSGPLRALINRLAKEADQDPGELPDAAELLDEAPGENRPQCPPSQEPIAARA